MGASSFITITADKPAPSLESLSRRFLFAVEIRLEKGDSPFNCWTAQERHPTFFRDILWLKNKRGIGSVPLRPCGIF